MKLNKEAVDNFSFNVKDNIMWSTKDTFDKALFQLIKGIEQEFTDNLVRAWDNEIKKQGEIGMLIDFKPQTDFEIEYDFFNIDELVEDLDYTEDEDEITEINNYIEFFGLTNGHTIPFIITGFRNDYFYTYNIKLKRYDFIGVNIV